MDPQLVGPPGLQTAAEVGEAREALQHLPVGDGPLPAPEEEYAYREQARRVLTEKTAYYAKLMGVTYGRISIRGQKTRWGSCSAKGNLNYNWKLMLCPEEVQDYVVVHELAHRREMNHSKAFYRIVEEILPDYRERMRWLKDHA